MKILHVNASDIDGGAARAAYRIHRSFVDHGFGDHIKSQMRVIRRLYGDPTVIGGPPAGQSPIWRRLQPHLSHQVRRGFRTGNPSLHSLAWPATGLGAELHARQLAGGVDLIHLHWLGDSTLSIEEIGRLPMPLVWSLHDMWAFCGAEHYTTDHRWREGYRRVNRPAHESGFDLNRHTWQRKRKHWRRPLQIVCPSQWLADCVRASAMMHEWPVAVVPNPIDVHRWRPIDQLLARQLMGLPEDCHLLLFGAMGGGTDSRKGIDLLLAALGHLRSEPSLQNLQLVVFGQLTPQYTPQLGFPVHYIGHLHDELSLRALYSAADAMVIPSRQDNLPNTGLEAHACGTPVVAFATCGLVDIVEDRVTGALAEPFDSGSLAAAIRWVLEDPQRRRDLGAEARQRAERLWNPARVASLYVEIYHEMMDSFTPKHQ